MLRMKARIFLLSITALYFLQAFTMKQKEFDEKARSGYCCFNDDLIW